MAVLPSAVVGREGGSGDELVSLLSGGKGEQGFVWVDYTCSEFIFFNCHRLL